MFICIYRLDLVGNSDYERGYAHGSLMAKEIAQFVEVELSKYYMSLVMSIDLRYSFNFMIRGINIP